MIAMSKLATARRTHGFTESVIREMTRLCHAHDGVNLSQGFPNCPAPDAVKRAACEAVGDDINQYAVTWVCLLFIHPRAPNLINLRSASTMPA